MRTFLLCILLLSFGISSTVYSQYEVVDPYEYNTEGFVIIKRLPSGEPDPSFGENGHTISLPFELPDIHVLDDGGFIVFGNSSITYGYEDFRDDILLYKFTSDGILDTTFNHGGYLSYSASESTYDVILSIQITDFISLLGRGRTAVGGFATHFLLAYDLNGKHLNSFTLAHGYVDAQYYEPSYFEYNQTIEGNKVTVTSIVYDEPNFEYWYDTIVYTIDVPGSTGIEVGSVPGLTCAGAKISIPFTCDFNFDEGNVFTAQLSDQFGNFDNPVEIGTVSGTGSGTIEGTIPAGIPTGTNYRIRIVSSSPVITSKPGSSMSMNRGLTVTTEVTPATIGQSDGSIKFYPSGGNSGYLFSLSGSDFQTSNLFSGLAAATYSAEVKDLNGCSKAVENIVVGSTNAIIVTVSKTAASACLNDGSITLGRTNGTAPFTYSLNDGPFVSNPKFSNLASGIYKGAVKDSKGRTGSLENIVLDRTPDVVVTQRTTNSGSCVDDGTITLFANGGTYPFTYSLDGGPFTTTYIFSNLAGGSTHIGRIKDAKGCIGILENIVVGTKAPVVVTSRSTNASSCLNDGSITLFGNGGTVPYTYSINNGPFVTNARFSNLAAGTYSGAIKDAKGCIVSVTNIVVGKVNPIVVSVSLIKNASSCSSTNGTIRVTATGGTSPFTYSLNNGAYKTPGSFSNLAPGTYSVSAKDSKGCVGSVGNIVLGPGNCASARGAGVPITKFTRESLKLEIESYPNPSASEFTLIVKGGQNDPLQIVVRDMLGRTVYQSSNSAATRYQFGKRFAPGMYVVEVVSGNKLKTLKLIKSR